ncbi:hypothetical protein ACFPES_31115 [Paenibacillus sp. GCM10023248]|uniref:hypothetical protein n=1 Tax=unclassified Paenibacillus TaxID=185978 RepID=UPI002379C67C|nr:hypothetical protein [Paenibacillus sp. MAHUQ-63]MDD9271495.1 hypothetical protein [Paenibacillus sp. MAHUQ-63]
MGLFGDLFKSGFENLLDTASDEELADEYETRRLEWLKDGGGDRTNEMERLNDEMVRRSNEKYEKEHPNAKARHREHGWYLSNDD